MNINKIYLDLGHGGGDTGAVAFRKTEKQANLLAGMHLVNILRDAGFEVMTSRLTDRYVSLKERTDQANEWGADLFLSLHADASNNISSSGFYCIHSIHNTTELSKDIVAGVERWTGEKPFSFSNSESAGVWKREGSNGDYYHVIRASKMQAIIIERGFMTNIRDNDLLFNMEFIKKQNRGVLEGIVDYNKLGEKEEIPTMIPHQEPEWKYLIMDKAISMGLIEGGKHHPDQPAEKWFVLAVIMNDKRGGNL